MKFFHLKKTEGWNGKPIGYTVGYERLSDETLLVTFARCGVQDAAKGYVKARGRAICRGRFNKNIYTEVHQPKGTDLYEVLLRATQEHEQKVKANYKQQT